MYAVIEYIYQRVGDPLEGRVIARFTDKHSAESFIAPFIFRLGMLANDSELAEYKDGDIFTYSIRKENDIPVDPEGSLQWIEIEKDDGIMLIPEEIE